MKYTFATIAIFAFVCTLFLSLISADTNTLAAIGIGIACGGFAIATAMLWKK